MKKVKISIIAAMSENRAIGYKDKIPWHMREDMIHFKEKTTGHAIIMGRKTFESLLGYYKRSGKPLPKRINIILTRKKKLSELISLYRYNDIYFAHSLEESIEIAKKYEKKEILIAGGAQVFKQGIKHADKLYLTILKGNFKGDAFFPDYSEFKKIDSKKESQDKNYRYTFLELER